MRWVAVVEARVAGFGAVEVAVEGGYFDADFGDEVAGEVGGEGGWVVGCWVGEEVVVEEVGYGHLASHCACWGGSADVGVVFGGREEGLSCSVRVEARLCRVMMIR